MTPDDIIAQLNHLIRVNKDAEAAFRTAAEDIENSELETLFDNFAKQHGKFVVDLQQEIARLGGTAGDSGTWEGAFHRSWVSLKSAVSGHSAGAILASCESGEESAQITYDNAAEANFTGQPHSLIEKQRQQIRQFHTRLARLAAETKHGLEFPKNE